MPQLSLVEGYRYRKQRGVNLGSWFVLEKWITPRPFDESGGSCDLDVARSRNAKQILEHHWDTWITADDWKWLDEKGINSVRLPIGYYHLVGVYPDVVKGTDFDGLGQVFVGAWQRILNAIQTAERQGCGVLIDLHSAVGKQNGDAHSGVNGPVRFYEERNMHLTLVALQCLVQNLKDVPNVVGIELMNEPQNNGLLPNWYTTSLDNLRKYSPDLPLYIHDAWSTGQYADLLKSRQDFVVLDHHLYRCFTTEDQKKSGDQHARELASNTTHQFKDFSSKISGNFVVAEYSAALNPSSLKGDAGEQDRQRRVFAKAELDMYDQCCGGSWFWCYKKQEGWDAGWSLRDTTTAEITPSFWGKKKSKDHYDLDVPARDREKKQALDAHAGYWSKFPGHYEHWRFEIGFDQGWSDAVMLLNFSPGSAVSELGFVGQWMKRRVKEHIQSKGNNNIWEFEHGFSQGEAMARKNML